MRFGGIKIYMTRSTHQALPDLCKLSPPIRKKCLKSLYRTCGRLSLIPRALKVPVCYDRNGHPLYKGGFADVWKGEHSGRDVAVKVLRIYSTGDLQRIIDVGFVLCFLSRVYPLTEHCVEVLQGGRHMESPSTPKCAATDRGDDD